MYNLEHKYQQQTVNNKKYLKSADSSLQKNVAFIMLESIYIEDAICVAA